MIEFSTATEQAPEGRVVVRDLWKVYGPRPDEYVARARVHDSGEHDLDGDHTAAARGVSFDVRPGERFVVMGLSGSGKSTLVRCLTRLIEPTHGQVEIGDRMVTDMSPKELRDLRRHDCAMVFQHFGLLPHRRVIENVAYGLEVAGVSRHDREARASELLALVGLNGWEQRRPSELSGGMQQRVGLARALAAHPKLLLLDEPFSALDPLIRKELQDELIRLADATSQTSIFITHDMPEALKVGDRIAIMRAGKIVQIGTPEDVVLRPVDDYVRRFSQDASRMGVVRAHTVCTPVPVIAGSTPLGEVLNEIRANDFGYAFVINTEKKVTGTVDLATVRGADARILADQVSSPDVASVGNDALLEDIAELLTDGASRVAVTDHLGNIEGGIGPSDVLSALTDVPTLIHKEELV